jgi:hypothetical protein
MVTVKTQPQYWFLMEPRPTEELLRIWKRRRIDPEPGIDLAQVEQVLIARHVLTPSFPGNSVTRTIGPIRDSFIVEQRSKGEDDQKWEVNLSDTLAEFINIHGRERFLIDRSRGRLEFQFQHGGFMMLSESTSALVRGKVFDFGKFKPLLESWMPALTREDLNKELRFWGWVMTLVGAISLLQTKTMGPIMGGLLVILGLVNLLTSWRGIFIINGIMLLAAGGIGLYGLFTTFESITGAIPIVIVFWAFLSLFELLWGYQEFHKFNQFRVR